MRASQFDAAKLHWLGTSAPSIEVLGVWRKTGVASVEDARHKEVVIGASSRGSNTWAFPTLMNELFGTRFKVVTGYNAGAQINLAMERGEVDGRVNSWASFKANKPQWVKDKLVNFIARSGPPAPDLDAPSVEEMAKTPADRQFIELVLSGSSLGRPFAIAPGVPEERVKALRAAFDATMKDPAFIAEAAALEFRGRSGQRGGLQKTVEEIVEHAEGRGGAGEAVSGVGRPTRQMRCRIRARHPGSQSVRPGLFKRSRPFSPSRRTMPGMATPQEKAAP